MSTDDDSLELDPIFIIYSSYANKANEDEIIDALKQETRQVHLVYLQFDDDIFNQSEEIQEAILLASKKTSGLLTKVSCYNTCTNQNPQQQLHTRCLEFFCQLLEGGRNNHNQGAGFEDISYFDSHPLTLIDANKVAAAIASSSNIKRLIFSTRFHIGGSFECVFNAVLDRGIKDFRVLFTSTTQAELHAIDIKNLTNNTTLKTLILYDNDEGNFPTGFTEQFAMHLVNILKTNQSLEKSPFLHIC